MGTNGTLISIEGLDGCGKTTLLDALDERYDITRTKEPTDMWTGDMVYESLKDDDASPLQDFFLFLADRANHVQKAVWPALQRGETVITDRYSDSTRAYQTHRIAEQMGEEKWIAFWWMNDMFGPWNIEPDRVLYLDVSVDTAVERCGAEDKYEKRSNLETVRENYLSMYDLEAEWRGAAVTTFVDAERDADVVEEDAVATLDL